MHGFKSSIGTDSLSFTISESSHQSTRRVHERTLIFATRLDYALLIIGLQTGVIELMVTFIQVENHGGVFIFVGTFILAIFVTLPLMVHQIFYGFYTKYGFIKYWNMAPVAFGIGFSMALYSVYECVVWAAVTALLILHICYIPFRSISEWTTCSKIERPEGVLCYDAESNLPRTSCDLTSYPALEFYRKITYEPQQSDGYNGINGAWFVCCFVLWLFVFVMVSQGFRRLRKILIRLSMVSLLALVFLAVISFSIQKKGTVVPSRDIFEVNTSTTRSTIVWLVWHAIRVVQIQLGTMYQLGSYFPPGSPLISDTVMIVLFICFYNLGFAYFAHSCHSWIQLDFIDIGHRCLAPDVMVVLFASVPTAISFLAMGNIWLFVYYTAFAIKTIVQIVITLTATMNALSEVFHLHRHRQQIVAVLCTVALLLDLPFTMTNSEMFFTHICRLIELVVDLCIVSCSGAVLICLYSLARVFDDIHFVYEVEPAKFQKLVSYVSPVFIGIIVIIGLTLVILESPSDPIFADSWTGPFAGVTVFALLAPIPGFALYVYLIHLMKHNISGMLQPTAAWGPPEADVKRARLNFNPRSALRYRSKHPCTHNCLLNNLRIKIEVEKRESQRNEFFLNVFQSPSYSEWYDDQDWHYGRDIIGKARTLEWAGDFRSHRPNQAINPITVTQGNEEQREDKGEDDIEDGGNADVEPDVGFRTEPEEDVEVVADGTFVSESDDPNNTEMDFEPDIILPADLNSFGPRPAIKNLDTHNDVDRRLPRSSPRYAGDRPTHLRQRRRSTKEQVAENPIEPIQPSITKIQTSRIQGKRLKIQSRSESSQTEKRLKRLRRLILGILPWRKSNRRKQRCVGTHPRTWSSAGPSRPISYESGTSYEMDEWP